MADPLGRKHQTVKKPNNRWQVDKVCHYVLEKEKAAFKKKPSSNHIYFDAYTLIYGTEEAQLMLRKAWGDQ